MQSRAEAESGEKKRDERQKNQRISCGASRIFSYAFALAFKVEHLSKATINVACLSSLPSFALFFHSLIFFLRSYVLYLWCILFFSISFKRNNKLRRR
jgi:hypothetical protein